MDRSGRTKRIPFVAIVWIVALAKAYAAATPHNIDFNITSVGISRAKQSCRAIIAFECLWLKSALRGSLSHNIGTAITAGMPSILMGVLTHFEPPAVIHAPVAFGLMTTVTTPSQSGKSLALHG